MQIRLLKSFASPEARGQSGQIIEVSRSLADQLIAVGAAERFELSRPADWQARFRFTPPKGLDDTEYSALLTADGPTWAWEWLRRNSKYQELCAEWHWVNQQGADTLRGVSEEGPIWSTPHREDAFRFGTVDKALRETFGIGHAAHPMSGYGEVLHNVGADIFICQTLPTIQDYSANVRYVLSLRPESLDPRLPLQKLIDQIDAWSKANLSPGQERDKLYSYLESLFAHLDTRPTEEKSSISLPLLPSEPGLCTVLFDLDEELEPQFEYIISQLKQRQKHIHETRVKTPTRQATRLIRCLRAWDARFHGIETRQMAEKICPELEVNSALTTNGQKEIGRLLDEADGYIEPLALNANGKRTGYLVLAKATIG